MELAEQLVELAELFAVSAETLAKLVAELVAELVGRTELEARVEIRQLEAQVEIRQPEELEVLLMAVRY